MQRRFVVLLAVLAVISGWGTSRAHAQGPAPTAYSIYEDPGFVIMGKSTVNVSRDGNKEVVDQIMPVGEGRDKEYHGHLVYDFAAHTLFTAVLSDPGAPCGAQIYNDPIAPPEFDMIAGAAGLTKELSSPDDKIKELGSEVLNGIPTRVVYVTSNDMNGKIWYAKQGGYPLKVLVIDKQGKETEILEVKKITYSKPPASAFDLPPSCNGVEPPPPPVVPSTKVTALTLAPIPNFTGACPAHVKMTGTITVDKPGTVFYQFGAGTMNPGKLIVFDAAGTQTVTDVFTFQPKYGNQMGVGAILEAIGAEASGRHDTLTQGSNNSQFTITCTSGGGK